MGQFFVYFSPSIFTFFTCKTKLREGGNTPHSLFFFRRLFGKTRGFKPRSKTDRKTPLQVGHPTCVAVFNGDPEVVGGEGLYYLVAHGS